MTIDWNAITAEVLERDGPMCGCCGERPWVVRHHALIRRDVHRKKWLDVSINIQGICSDCDATGRCDSRENRSRFAKHLISLGYDVDGWLASLTPIPYKIVPRI
jgi:hypothetical protein